MGVEAKYSCFLLLFLYLYQGSWGFVLGRRSGYDCSHCLVVLPGKLGWLLWSLLHCCWRLCMLSILLTGLLDGYVGRVVRFDIHILIIISYHANVLSKPGQSRCSPSDQNQCSEVPVCTLRVCGPPSVWDGHKDTRCWLRVHACAGCSSSSLPWPLLC